MRRSSPRRSSLQGRQRPCMTRCQWHWSGRRRRSFEVQSRLDKIGQQLWYSTQCWQVVTNQKWYPRRPRQRQPLWIGWTPRCCWRPWRDGKSHQRRGRGLRWRFISHVSRTGATLELCHIVGHLTGSLNGLVEDKTQGNSRRLDGREVYDRTRMSVMHTTCWCGRTHSVETWLMGWCCVCVLGRSTCRNKMDRNFVEWIENCIRIIVVDTVGQASYKGQSFSLAGWINLSHYVQQSSWDVPWTVPA